MDVHDYLSKCDHEQAWHDSPLDTLAVHAADLAHRIDVSGEPMHAEIAALVSLIEQQAKRPPTFVRFETVYWIGERRFVVCTGTQTDCLAGLLAAQKRTRASVRWAIVSASGQAVYASEKSGRKVFGLSLDGLFRKVGEMKKGEEQDMAFNVGDYVEVVDTGRVAFGESGDIVEIIPAYSGHSSVQTYRVRLNDGVEMDFVSSDLAIAERSEPAFKLVERISQLQATIDRLQAENARLRDALAPFAENWRGYREYLSMDIGTKTLTEWLDWAVDQSTLRTDFANAEQIDATPPIEGEVP